MADKIGGILMGIVIDNHDPAGYKRVRVRIPALHGAMTKEFYPDETMAKTNRTREKSLPWVPVCYPLGSDIPPEPNQVVFVGFISGDPDKPVVLGWLGYEYTDKEDTLIPIVYSQPNGGS